MEPNFSNWLNWIPGILLPFSPANMEWSSDRLSNYRFSSFLLLWTSRRRYRKYIIARAIIAPLVSMSSLILINPI